MYSLKIISYRKYSSSESFYLSKTDNLLPNFEHLKWRLLDAHSSDSTVPKGSYFSYLALSLTLSGRCRTQALAVRSIPFYFIESSEHFKRYSSKLTSIPVLSQIFSGRVQTKRVYSDLRKCLVFLRRPDRIPTRLHQL